MFSWLIWTGRAWKERPGSSLPMKLAFMVRSIRPEPKLFALCTLIRCRWCSAAWRGSSSGRYTVVTIPVACVLVLKVFPYTRAATLNTKDQVHAMQKVMGDSNSCILRGHGLIVAGSSVEQATITAIKIDTLAKMNLQAASIGKVPSIPDEDISAFQSRTGRGNSSAEGLWRYYCEWLTKG